MKRTLTVKEEEARILGWDNPCGCPLWKQLTEKGFAVKRVDEEDWTDTNGRRHEFHPPFTLIDYIEVLRTGKPFQTKTSDE